MPQPIYIPTEVREKIYADMASMCVYMHGQVIREASEDYLATLDDAQLELAHINLCLSFEKWVNHQTN